MATLSRNLNLRVDWHDKDAASLKKGHRLTTIICTIGPKTKDVPSLKKLLQCGMQVCRLNFSHGTHEYHAEVIANLRTALKELGGEYRCALMLDTKGPEIRTGKLKDKTLKITAGQEIDVTTDLSVTGDEKVIVVDYQQLCESAKVGNVILISDGTISLTIKSIHTDQRKVRCVVNNSSVLGENKNVHLPGAVVQLPAVSDIDRADLIFGVKQNVDLIAASFVRTANDVEEIRSILKSNGGGHIKIVSKIESTEGVENVRDIVEASDGIMVARGDLGVEIPMEQIFIAQKLMISLCNSHNKPVITATQMLESMIQNPRPTRAEATDVANAVLDGSDCVMLSGETASGDYPLEAVTYMDRICREAEKVEASGDYPSLFEALKLTSNNSLVPEVVCSYVVRTANDLKAQVVIVFSESGFTARLIAKYRPRVPVFCMTNSESTANFLLLSRGVISDVIASMQGTDAIIAVAMEKAKKMGLCSSGGIAVIVHGTFEGNPGNSNVMKVLTIP